VKEELLAWIFERREMWLVVSTLNIIIKACCLLPLKEFQDFIWPMLQGPEHDLC